MQTHPITPACHHAAGNTVVQRRGMSFLRLRRRWLCPYLEYLANNPAQFRKAERISQTIFGIYETLQLLLDNIFIALSSRRAPTTKTEAFEVPLSQNNGLRPGRRPLSDKKTKIYKHVVLSHKVKEIWGYDGVGWGGVEYFPSQKHN